MKAGVATVAVKSGGDGSDGGGAGDDALQTRHLAPGCQADAVAEVQRQGLST